MQVTLTYYPDDERWLVSDEQTDYAKVRTPAVAAQLAKNLMNGDDVLLFRLLAALHD